MKYSNKDDIITGVGSKVAGARWNPRASVPMCMPASRSKRQGKGREALPQAIGRLAYELDLQALLVASAAQKRVSNVVLFPEKLHPPKSWLRIVNREDLPKQS
jgi:RES domain-containing protein